MLRGGLDTTVNNTALLKEISGLLENLGVYHYREWNSIQLNIVLRVESSSKHMAFRCSSTYSKKPGLLSWCISVLHSKKDVSFHQLKYLLSFPCYPDLLHQSDNSAADGRQG
jgi:hypothetical protein